MSNESSARWEQLVHLHEEIEDSERSRRSEAVLPMRISGIDGSPVKASPRAVQFAEALAFSAGWSGISEARRRRRQVDRDDLAA